MEESFDVHQIRRNHRLDKWYLCFLELELVCGVGMGMISVAQERIPDAVSFELESWFSITVIWFTIVSLPRSQHYFFWAFVVCINISSLLHSLYCVSSQNGEVKYLCIRITWAPWQEIRWVTTKSRPSQRWEYILRLTCRLSQVFNTFKPNYL